MAMDIGHGWNYLEHVLCSGFQSDWCPITPCQDLTSSILACVGVIDLLEEWLYEKIFQDLNQRVRPDFWNHFKDADANRSSVFGDAIHHLHSVYVNRYMVALKRLRWIQTLAASAPATSIRDAGVPSMSAFTPVKASVHFERDTGGRLQGPRNLSPLFSRFSQEDEVEEDEKRETMTTTDHPPRRHSVTFEKGTKGGTEGSAEFKGSTMDMDGSYVDDKSVFGKLTFSEGSSPARDFRSFPDPPPSTVTSKKNSVVGNLMSEEEDMESFIRSPIGGNKKLMASSSSSHSHPFSGSSAAKPLFFYGGSEQRSSSGRHQSQSMADSSSTSSVLTSNLTQTSTPGFILKQTPGPITPILQTDRLADISLTSHLSELTPTIEMMEDRSQTNKSLSSPAEILPDASAVFGVSIPSRPVPGLSVYWPKDDADTPQARVSTMIRAALFYTFPNLFFHHVKVFYSEAFDTHKASMDSADQSTDCDDSSIAKQDNFDEVNRQMEAMGVMERISGSAVTEIVHNQIEKHIAEECKGNFDASYLSELEEWLDQLVIGWLIRIHHTNRKTAAHASSIKAFGDRLYHFLYETYARSLIGQLFDIIIDFPDSKPAILDLCTCLEKTDLRSELVSTLKTALENRLLHPGVNTADILTAYIAAIKALRILEPAGVILELVCEPVRRYLRSREDTVRCIVASLTDEGSNELISELVNIKPQEQENEEDGSMKDWDNWMPDPVDADPSIVSKNRRSADILSILVNIYGSKELFVNEYRALLADRILMQYNYDEQRELRYLELLKLRFGEAQLHFCEVMLRDVTESRRINSRIQETKNSAEVKPDDLSMNAMILSAQFWPAFREEKITLPGELQAHLDKYTKSFEGQKQNRTLVWKPHLGIMNIELELKEETLNFSVSPVLAAIIMKFQDKTKWTVEELSNDLEMTATVVRRKISFWQGQGLLREISPDVYQLVEERKGRPHDLVMVDEEEVESAMASAQQQKEEEMQVFWTYIQGMLANLDCLPLERIHSMLRMFGMEEPSSNEISLQELKTFLDNKVKDQILVFTGGVYKLNKG